MHEFHSGWNNNNNNHCSLKHFQLKFQLQLPLPYLWCTDNLSSVDCPKSTAGISIDVVSNWSMSIAESSGICSSVFVNESSLNNQITFNHTAAQWRSVDFQIGLCFCKNKNNLHRKNFTVFSLCWFVFLFWCETQIFSRCQFVVSEKLYEYSLVTHNDCY